MKTQISFFLFLCSFFVFCQTASTLKIGAFRLGMTQNEVAAIIGKKVILKDANYDGEMNALVFFNGISYTINFRENAANNEWFIFSIETTNPKIKTASKIGIGNTFDDLWNAYKNKYKLIISNEWDSDAETYKKDTRIFIIEDTDARTQLFFIAKNNKIQSIGVTYASDEGCF